MRRDRPPPREAGGLQRRARHHPDHDQAQHPRHRRPHRQPRQRAGRHRRRGRAATSSATTCAPISRISRSACARPRPTSSSRKPGGCATRSGGSRPTSSACPTDERKAPMHGPLERGQAGHAQDALRQAAGDADGETGGRRRPIIAKAVTRARATQEFAMIRPLAFAAILALAACARSEEANLVAVDENASYNVADQVSTQVGRRECAEPRRMDLVDAGRKARLTVWRAADRAFVQPALRRRRRPILQRHGIKSAGKMEMMNIEIDATARRLAVEAVEGPLPLLTAAVRPNSDLIARCATPSRRSLSASATVRRWSCRRRRRSAASSRAAPAARPRRHRTKPPMPPRRWPIRRRADRLGGGFAPPPAFGLDRNRPCAVEARRLVRSGMMKSVRIPMALAALAAMSACVPKPVAPPPAPAPRPAPAPLPRRRPPTGAICR